MFCPFMSRPTGDGKIQPVDCEPQSCGLGNKQHNCCQLTLVGAKKINRLEPHKAKVVQEPDKSPKLR